MAKIKAEALMALFEQMALEHWAYDYGAARKGVVDCSGAFVYASEVLGGPDLLHSSNRIARLNCGEMLPIGEAKPGYAAFRWRKDFETAELEEKYNDGLGDFKHMGLVSRDGRHVLHAKGEKYGFVRAELDGSWQYASPLSFVEYGSEDMDVPMDVLYMARIATNKDPLRVREWPKTGEILGHINRGIVVEVLEDKGDGWPLIRFNELKGYASAQYLTPVVREQTQAVGVQLVIRDSEGNEFRPVGEVTMQIEITVDGND